MARKIVIITILIILAWTVKNHQKQTQLPPEPTITNEFMPDTPEKEKLLLQAIWHAEGGNKTRYPFGIKSIKCEGYHDCRRICTNTIRANIKRYEDYGNENFGSYLEFLASRYAPIGADNDESNLNRFWIGNVKHFLANPLEITL